MPLRKPADHSVPSRFSARANPTPADPPVVLRPAWNTEKIVAVPGWKMSGATSVRCWPSALVNGSELTWVRATLA